jgi:hypothetical protein
MVTRSGQEPGPGVSLTREVRWFRHGELPETVLAWFTDGVEFGVERRTDHYDLRAAGRNVGVKRRSTISVDSKFRVLLIESISLGSGLSGHVEDWMKISEPLGNGVSTDIVDPIDVTKELFTRRFELNGSAGAGCEAELASVAAGRVRAWSLCFETFGSPERRGLAFRNGIDRLLAETPLPADLELGPESCHGYPEWINDMALEQARGRTVGA